MSTDPIRDLVKFQIKKVFLSLLIEHHPSPIDFDLLHQRYALPADASDYFNAFGGIASACKNDGLAVPVGMFKSERRPAHRAKSQRWIACDLPRIRAWLDAHSALELPPPPEPDLFGPTGEATP